MRSRIISALALAACTCAASGQSAMFLAPESAEVALGSTVRLSAVRAGEAVAEVWPRERIAHFFARTAWTQENRDTVSAEADSDRVAVWPADRPGVLVLGVDLQPRTERPEAGAFAGFVERAVGESVRKSLGALPAEGEIAVRRTESAKALVRVRDDGAAPASVATSKTGQAVEIRPLMDPTALLPGSDLAVRLYARIAGSSGGVVIATNETTGEAVRAVADDASIANIRLAHAGRWRLEFHALAPLAGPDTDAAWDLHTATLTFDVEEANQ